MQLSALISSLALLAATSVIGVTIPRSFGYSDLELVAGTYTGTYNGHDYSIQADDVADLAAQLETLHGPRVRDISVNLDERVPLNKRNKDRLLCTPVEGHDWQFAIASEVSDGVRLIKSIGGKIDIGTQCVRLSCTGNAGIYLCNDNNYRIQPGLDYMASYAQDIIDKCSLFPPFAQQICGGQEFDTDHYNIVVRYGCQAL